MATGNELSKIHLAHKNMLDRCYNPKNAAYPNYGGRGIRVCDEWRTSRHAFVAWAFQAGHDMQLTLDRIDTDGNYSPANCRWATIKTQLRNQRRNRLLTIGSITMCASAWAEAAGIRSDTLIRRVELGHTMDETILQPERVGAWRHGTRAGYEIHGCRCDACRESNNARHRKQRARRKAALGEQLCKKD